LPGLPPQPGSTGAAPRGLSPSRTATGRAREPGRGRFTPKETTNAAEDFSLRDHRRDSAELIGCVGATESGRNSARKRRAKVRAFASRFPQREHPSVVVDVEHDTSDVQRRRGSGRNVSREHDQDEVTHRRERARAVGTPVDDAPWSPAFRERKGGAGVVVGQRALPRPVNSNTSLPLASTNS
jgi:hypothetical protein